MDRFILPPNQRVSSKRERTDHVLLEPTPYDYLLKRFLKADRPNEIRLLRLDRVRRYVPWLFSSRRRFSAHRWPSNVTCGTCSSPKDSNGCRRHVFRSGESKTERTGCASKKCFSKPYGTLQGTKKTLNRLVSDCPTDIFDTAFSGNC